MPPARRPSQRRSSAASGPSPRSPAWILTRVLLAAVTFGVLSFAVQGGEYGSLDLFRQGRQLDQQRSAVDSLQRRVDSLTAYLKAVRTDPATQERIAREEFGMVKPGEVLYRFADPE